MAREIRGERRYPQKQCANMRIDPYASGRESGYMLALYPHLAPLFEVPPEITLPSIDRDKFIKWMSFVYDPASPIVKEFQGDVPAAMQRAADEVGGFKLEHRSAYMFVVRRFLREVLHSQIWAEITTLDNLFWEYQKHLTEPVVAESEEERLKAVERQGKMSEKMSQFRERAAGLRKILYGEDQELANEEEDDLSPEGQNRLRKALRGQS